MESESETRQSDRQQSEKKNEVRGQKRWKRRLAEHAQNSASATQVLRVLEPQDTDTDAGPKHQTTDNRHQTQDTDIIDTDLDTK